MKYEFFIGSRYIRSRQRSSFISLITGFAVSGVIVGVMVMVVVIAVMSGAETAFRKRILGVSSHLLIMRHGGPFAGYKSIIDFVEKIEGVDAATPFIYTQVILRSKSSTSNAVLRGIDPESAKRVTTVFDSESLKEITGKKQKDNSKHRIPGIIIGKELARELNVNKGDSVIMVSPGDLMSSFGNMPVMKQFNVVGLVDSGMYEYDSTLAYIHINEAQTILNVQESVTGIEVRVFDIYNARHISEEINEKLKFPYWTRDWMQMNQNLFAALKLDKTVMFVILILIILVAAFNIASVLIMMVMEKTRDIAILKTMGSSNKSIKKIFLFKGMIIGIIGTLLGTGIGLILCQLLKKYRFIKLDPKIYPFTTLPVNIEIIDIAVIAVSTLVICFIASIYPAYKASRLKPVEGIRYG
jgi:lipoprotein-releasing system permease protein